MAGNSSRSVGKDAERLAEKYLVESGLTILDRNFHCRHGEIDLIMLDRGTLAFVEVRMRCRNRFTRAAATVDARKQRKLLRSAAIYLGRHRRFSDHAIRFDVIGIDTDRTTFSPAPGEFTIQWLKDAFRPRSLNF